MIPGAVLKHCQDSLCPCLHYSVPEVSGIGSHPLHLEVLKCCPCPQGTLPVCPQRLSSHCPDIYPLQMYKTTACGYPIVSRPVVVCLHSKQKHRGCYPDCDPCRFETPGEAKGLCPDALPGLLVGVQHNPASSADAEADGHGHQPRDHPLALQLPDRQATTCCGQVVDYLGGVIRGPQPTLEPLKDVCSHLRCSRCTHPTAGVYCQRHTSGQVLGRHVADRPHHAPNALALLKKGNQRLYFMKKLKSFSVCPKLLELFYKSTVESVVTFSSLCHFGGLKEQDKARLSKITKTASRLIGRPVPDLSQTSRHTSRRKQ